MAIPCYATRREEIGFEMLLFSAFAAPVENFGFGRADDLALNPLGSPENNSKGKRMRIVWGTILESRITVVRTLL